MTRPVLRWLCALPVLVVVLVVAGCPHHPPGEASGCIVSGDGGGPGMCANEEPEPNDSMVLAWSPVPPTSGAAGAPPPSSWCRGSADGAISGTQDVDVLHTSPCSKGSKDPTAQLVMDGGPPLRLCLFPVCKVGTTNVWGCYASAPDDQGAWLTVNETGFKGCCRSGPGTVSARMGCSSLYNATIDGFVWIDGNEQPISECTPYHVSWEMN
jgi:hypothetical protein